MYYRVENLFTFEVFETTSIRDAYKVADSWYREWLRDGVYINIMLTNLARKTIVEVW